MPVLEAGGVPNWHDAQEHLMNRPLTFIFLIVCALIAQSFCGCEMILAEKGETSYVIAYGEKADAAETFAAQELATYLKKVAGVRFPLVAETDLREDRFVIYVGPTEFAKSHGINTLELGEEEWVIKTIGNHLIIAGGRPRGTLYGVYEFLEKHLECHWFDMLCEAVPSRPTLKIPGINLRAMPAFAWRNIATTHYDYQISADPAKSWEYSLFLARNKKNTCLYTTNDKLARLGFDNRAGSPAGDCHTFGFYVNWQEYYEAHPEYFSMNEKGERESGKGKSARAGYQLCLSNPAVRQIVLEKLKKYILADRQNAAAAGRPYPKIYDLSQNDGTAHLCLCPHCKTISAREGAESGLLLDFINEIADQIKTDYPDIYIQTFAYVCTEKPPKQIAPADNVIVRLCDTFDRSDLFRPLTHPLNRHSADLVKDWSRITKHLGMWDYWRTYGVGQQYMHTPNANIWCLKPDIGFFYANHVRFFMAEDEDYGVPENSFGFGGENFHSFSALQEWLGYKLLQDPKQDDQLLIEAFMKGYYGPAASEMKEYLAYLEKRMTTGRPGRLASMKAYARPYLDVEFFATVERILNDAESRGAPHSDELANVKMERITVDSTILGLWDKLEKAFASARQKMPFEREPVLARYKANRYLHADRFCSADIAAKFRTATDKEIEYLKNLVSIRIPEEFKDLPSDSVEVLSFTSFYGTTECIDNGLVKFEADQTAAGGKALVFYGGTPGGPIRDRPWPLDLETGIYNIAQKTSGPTLTVKAGDLPNDGKYHVYKLGKWAITPQTELWIPWTWTMRANLDRVYDPTFGAREWEVYISVKVLGSAYISGSSEKNSIWMDRVILVKPRT